MTAGNKAFRLDSQEKTWNKYCGFLDLSLPEFMEIQEYLLMEQIEMVFGSSLAQEFMPEKPKDVSEFRKSVPLTTYDDYITSLGEKNEDVLAFKPYAWVHTSGRGGSFKWVPYSQRGFEHLGISGVAMVILACAGRRGEVNIQPKLRVLQNLPPKPYSSWLGTLALLDLLDIVMIPPLESSETETFEERIQKGFEIALRTGVDVMGALTSVLIKMGERFTEGSGQIKISRKMLHPRVMLRLVRALLKSKLQRRPLLPKDLWPLKGLICYGMDTNVYKEQVIYYWGRKPLELYCGTETGFVAIQAWNKEGMTFFPFNGFLEFIPEEEWLKSREDKDYEPSTVLLNEVRAGKRYEVVVTNFYGMPFLRYRVGDLIRIVDLKDRETGIKIPQMAFDSRADDLIDIGGFTRLDEKKVWQAIFNSKIKHVDWCLRKEYDDNQPVLRLYIEFVDDIDKNEAQRIIDDQLRSLDHDYNDLNEMLGIQPLRVMALPKGSFQKYYQAKLAAGADLAHLKPAHMNAPESAIRELLG